MLLYQCFHCLCNSVVWDNDFNLEDIGLEGEGVVHMCHCTHCGAEIQYVCREKKCVCREEGEEEKDD